METQEHNIRLIIEEHEENIKWTDKLDLSKLLILANFSKDNLRKKFKADSFTYRDSENSHFSLDDIFNFELSPIFVSIPNRDIKTFNKTDQRPSRNEYHVKDSDTIRIKKFENDKKYEEVEMKFNTMSIMVDGNKNRSFEEKPKAGLLSKLNPFNYFGGSKQEEQQQQTQNSNSSSNFLNPNQTYGNDDFSKRQKVPLEDGKSQYKFIDQNTGNIDAPSKIELKPYTLQEVAEHNTIEDAWMVLNGKVYDVTKYIPFHPGGKKIMPGVGIDGTELFNKYHQWVNAHYLLQKYHIGFLKR